MIDKIEIKIYQHSILKMTSVTFSNYIKQYKAGKGSTFTHTRIGDTSLNVYPGSYNIPAINKDEFYRKYTEHVFTHNNLEFLTEKQPENGPIAIDIDMRYHTKIDTRKHTKNHVMDLIDCLTTILDKVFTVPVMSTFTIYIFEKSKVNMQDECTKDGMHLLININADIAEKCIIREMLVSDVPSIWDDLPFTNSWGEVFDEGVMKGFVNWQLTGSRKPGNKQYELTYHYKIVKSTPTDWELQQQSIEYDYKNIELFKQLTVQDMTCNQLVRNNDIESLHNDIIKALSFKITNSQVQHKPKSKHISVAYADISSKEELDEELEHFFENLSIIQRDLHDTHEYAMRLSKSYWGPGSFNKWIRVGWALKNTGEEMFLTWLKFSSQSEEFSFSNVNDMYNEWQQFCSGQQTREGLTMRSIMYWLKIDNPHEFHAVRTKTVDCFIHETVKDMNEFNFANVLYHLYKDRYICVGIANEKWYEYINHKWEECDGGTSLRLKISKDMHHKYSDKIRDSTNRLSTMESTSPEWATLRAYIDDMTSCCAVMKKTSWKNNIMKEAKELFYDKQFWDKIDTNPYLLCFNNGVIDFKDNIFRVGRPDDYITKCTKIDYIPIQKIKKKTLTEIDEFIEQLFPVKELNEYMWQHLASTLIGTNDNQTFNIYIGSGANGKSKLVDLMGKIMGDYKGVVPITVVTQKRNSIGSVSPEIAQLIGVRYAVMQEPSKGDKINEGIMKELTGGDPVQCRQLYSASTTFIPQFKLVVCTNNLFDITSNDDGTWRRIRVCDFQSKFTDNPYNNIQFPKEDYPYQYDINRHIDEKFEEWKLGLMSKLVQIAFTKNGAVSDCKMVLSSSTEYREGQDCFAEFIRDKVIRHEPPTAGEEPHVVRKSHAYNIFKDWYTENYGKNIPRGIELVQYMNKIFGGMKTTKRCKGWVNISINNDN